MLNLRHLGLSALTALALVGCDSSKPTPPAPEPAKQAPDGEKPGEVKSMPVESGKPADKAAAGEPTKPNTEEVAKIKELSPEDQEIALAQGVCPVSDQNLGSMGKPVKEMAGDKAVFLCCEACEKKFKEDPAKYAAKVTEKKKEM